MVQGTTRPSSHAKSPPRLRRRHQYGDRPVYFSSILIKIRNRERPFEAHSAPRTCQRSARPELCDAQVLYGSPTQVSHESVCCKHHADKRWTCRIAQYESDNSMSIQNLAIVFGPTLFGQISSNGSISGHVNGGMADAAFQNKVTLHAFFLSLSFTRALSDSYTL